MMKRRAIAGIVGILLLIAGVGTATAQEDTTSPTNPETTTTDVGGDSTTSEPETTTTTVAGDSIVPTTEGEAEVRGDVVSRPLPRTGNDIGGSAIFGAALTVLGIALALGARKRRNSFDGA